MGWPVCAFCEIRIADAVCLVCQRLACTACACTTDAGDDLCYQCAEQPAAQPPKE